MEGRDCASVPDIKAGTGFDSDRLPQGLHTEIKISVVEARRYHSTC